MTNLVELLGSENGLTNRSGEAVSVTPIGAPILMMVPRINDDFDRSGMDLAASATDQEVLETELADYKPDSANAYVLGEKYPIVRDVAPEHCSEFFAYPVQFYRTNQ